MKKKLKIPFEAMLLLFISVQITACKKFITVPPPVDQLTTQTVFASDDAAMSTLAGLYSKATENNTAFLNGIITTYPGLSADELVRNTSSTTEDQIAANAILSNNSQISNQWSSAYRSIYQTNSILDNLTNSSITADVRKRITGETKFIRALYNFYAFNFWGSIPLAVISDYNVTGLLHRSDSAIVYDSIIADLKSAQTLLGDYTTTERVRATKWAATALLARVYLYTRRWESAITEASVLINSGRFKLAPLSSVFMPNNTEAILQFLPPITQIFNTAEGYLFIPSSATVVPTYSLSVQLVNAFEANDQRKVTWLNKNTVSGKTYFYPYKYKVRSTNAGSTKLEYSTVLRLSEMYLIRAEAYGHMNMLTESMRDIDSIRIRAGLNPIKTTLSTVDQTSILQSIIHENQVEFFAEWGHRWFDLKRNGIAPQVLAPIKAQWQNTAVLYPIPQSELLLNPYLTQNSGY